MAITRGHRLPNPHEIPEAVGARAIRNYYFESPTGCYVSTYSVASHGYAQIGWSLGTVDGKPKTTMTTAHRAAWTFVHGPIPEGMTIDHTCKNKRCVNLLHLRMLSNFDNARRTDGRDWPLGQCINGHPDSELRIGADGKRVCRPCSAEWQRAYRERQAG
jgi:hypothetical protein